MSESIAISIPSRSGKQRAANNSLSKSMSSKMNNDSMTAGNSIGTPYSSASSSSSEGEYSSGRDKGKSVVRESPGSGWSSPWGTERRASLLSSSISRSEHTVVNIGDPDGPPRLITCVKASQGFDWNQDIFLPSYASDHDYTADLERRQDPVEDIFISDEEAMEMFPR